MKSTRSLLLFVALAVLAALGATFSLPASAAEDPTALSFPDLSTSQRQELLASSAPFVAESMSSSSENRVVAIDAAAVAAELDKGSVRLELYPGRVIEMTVLRRMTNGDSTSWVGTTPRGGSASVVVRGDAVMATMQMLNGPVSITNVAGGAHLIHNHAERVGQLLLDPDISDVTVLPPPPEGAESAVPAPILSLGSDIIGNERLGFSAAANAPAAVAAAAGTNIDVMFVYDSLAATHFGSATNALNAFDAGIALSNAGYVNSGIDLMLTRIHAEQINYTGSLSLSTDLTRVREANDGFIDWVHDMRDAHNADLVALITETPAVNSCGGIANVLQDGTPTSDNDQTAFQVTEATCVTLTVFGHEVGHNLGAVHDNANSNFPGAFPFSYGWVDTVNNFRTIMAYGNAANGCTGCPRINQFSSPTLLYQGHPTGDATHDNVQTLSSTKAGVAAYRPHPCPPPENDEFEALINLGSTYSATILGTTTCATVGAESWWVPSAPVQSVWYEWTAPTSGTMTASTCSPNTNYDTDLTLLGTGGPGDLLSGGYADNTGSCAVNSNQAILNFTVTGGTTYRLKVDGPGSASGDYELTISMPGGPAANDLTVLSSPCIAYASPSADAFGLSGQMAPASTRTVQIASTLKDQGGASSCVPAGASAAVLSVTAINPAGAGNLRVSAAGVAPEGGVVNYTSNGLNNSNTVTVPLSAAGRVDIAANAGATDVRVAVIGYYSHNGNLQYTPLTPCAVADSRGSQGASGSFDGPFAAGAAYPDLDVVGTFNSAQGGGNTDCGVPAGASAVMVNVVSVSGSGGAGGLAVGSGGSEPTVATTNFAAIGLNNAASTIVPLNGQNMATNIIGGSGSPSTEIRVVVLGYFTGSGNSYNSVNPCAVFDTRPSQSPTGGFAGQRVAGTATTYQVTGSATTGQGGVSGGCGVPGGASAVLINLVGISPESVGNLRAYATGSTPTGGVVNFANLTPAANNSNAVVVPLSGSGQMDLFVNAPSAGNNPTLHVRGVVLGYYN